MTLGRIDPKKQKGIEGTVERNSRMKGIGDLFKPLVFNSLSLSK
ncbi:MAG: hypothetical protein P8012_03865 [Desulfobacterales bacterium]